MNANELNVPCLVTLVGSSTCVAFHPTAPILATGSDDMTVKSVKLWRLSDNSALTCVATLDKSNEGHDGQVYSVAFHPTAPILATGSSDGTAKLWRLSADGATCVATLNVDRRDKFASLGFDPTGTVLATAGYNGTKLWDCRQFQRKNVTDDFGAMQRKLVKNLVGDSVNDHSYMQRAILNRVARGREGNGRGVDPVTATHVNAHLNQLYLSKYGSSVPFNPKTVHLKRLLLKQNADGENKKT